ncbi:hypothetical protein MRX96_011219 [Rhipicephalus microplus]
MPTVTTTKATLSRPPEIRCEQQQKAIRSSCSLALLPSLVATATASEKSMPGHAASFSRGSVGGQQPTQFRVVNADASCSSGYAGTARTIARGAFYPSPKKSGLVAAPGGLHGLALSAC